MNTIDTNLLLQAILDELRVSKQLGFGHPPKPRYIYANRQYSDCLWYFWNGAKNEHEPIEFYALTGIFERLEIELKEFRGKPDYKVNLHIRADRNYVIQAGYETGATRKSGVRKGSVKGTKKSRMPGQDVWADTQATRSSYHELQ